MMDGVINVYKEKGFTSHDVVAKMRGILKQNKIGHPGPRDPSAEGDVPVGLGRDSSVCDLTAARSRHHRAVMLRGARTDTQDTPGQIRREVV